MTLTRIVIVVVVAVLFRLVSSLNDVCALCHCDKHEYHYAIVCKCDREKALYFTDEFMKLTKKPNVSVSLSISGCEYVKFSRKLDLRATRVEVTGVTSLLIEERSFLRVGDVEIRRVASLTLSVGAFFRSELRALLVEDSHVRGVETNALCNVTGMQRLELSRVSVEGVETYAVEYFATKEQQFQLLIRDSQIRVIQGKGIDLKGDDMTITNSSFWSVDHAGISLNSLSHIRLTKNTFIKLRSDGSLLVHGRELHVKGNNFNLFPYMFSEQNLKENTGNEFQIPIYSLEPQTLYKMAQNLYYSSFQCECDDKFGKKLTSLHGRGLDGLLQSTFCISRERPRSITHYQMLQHFQRNWTVCLLDKKAADHHHPFTPVSPNIKASVSKSSGEHPFISTGILWLLLLANSF